MHPTTKPYLAPRETQSFLFQGPSLKPVPWNSFTSPGAQGAHSPRATASSLAKNGFYLVLTRVLRVGSYSQRAESKNRESTSEQSRAGSSCVGPVRVGSPLPTLDGRGP